MKLTFNIEYRTNWGEEVKIAGILPESIPMHTTDGIYWTAEITFSTPRSGKKIEYYYQIEEQGRVTRKEWNNIPRSIYISGSEEQKYSLNDSWKNIPEQMHLYSSAFTDVWLARDKKEYPTKQCSKSIIIKASAPDISPAYGLAISGNQKTLGNWDPEKAISMNDTHFPEWEVVLDANEIKYPLEYKFIRYLKTDRSKFYWEDNPNRFLTDPGLKPHETWVLSDRYIQFHIPCWKVAGMAIPIFSLRSQKSMGIGDFGDLTLLIDWAVKTKQKIIQILPINDTTMTHSWRDSYPYNSISIYALHPMYIDINQIGKLKNSNEQTYFQQVQRQLNALPFLDYEAVSKAKWDFLNRIYQQEGNKTLNTKSFSIFFQANKEWLQPYAVYCYLRDKNHTANFRDWPQHSVYNQEEINEMCSIGSEKYKEIGLYYFIQYHLHIQLKKAAEYAHSKGIVLKGDIPIGISRDSVEAWTEPHYFNLNGQAGAPPDDFSVNGQNWGFPTYNWDVMQQDGYKWWIRRFRKMATYFDAYRIDHILGFFRIWEIPSHAIHGVLGQFVPALPMQKEEIEGFGITFKEKYTEPYIHNQLLTQLFGPHVEFVKQHFLTLDEKTNTYRLLPAFNTQRAIEAYFISQNDEDSCWIREGLYTLIENVLFLRDKKDSHAYHPRITAQQTDVFRSLLPDEQEAFNRLYEEFYYHRHNTFWKEQAMEKLPQLTQSTRMLVCGEDLGMIPTCVNSVMNDLQILSLEIQRMPKSIHREFSDLLQNPYRSVCTISTHDMSTLRGWWEENYAQSQRYYNQILGHYGTAPTTATAPLCQEIVEKHLESNSLLCILSLQDWLSIDGKWRNPNVQDERINIPSNPQHYWRYRMHLTLEELLHADEINEKITEMIEKAGRA